MKKLIANLKVYVDYDEKEQPSAQTYLGGKQHEIVLRPESDKEQLKQIKNISDAPPLASIFAHELGHFVAIALGDPDHHPATRFVYGPLAGERNAWRIAEAITEIDPAIRDWALSGYESYYGKN